jgi:hypothetical protein
MKQFLTPLLLLILYSCSTRQKIKHAEFPDTITVTKTAAHIHEPETKIFYIPPKGFTKGKYSITYGSAEGGAETFNVTNSVSGANLPTNIDSLRKNMEASDHKILVIKPVTHNGLPAIYSESISMDKFYTASLQVHLKDSTILFIEGRYTYESKPENVDKLFKAMQNVLYDENYTIDQMAERSIRLDDSGSPFKFAKKDNNQIYYYSPGGQACDPVCPKPYVLFFDAMKETRRGGKITFESGGEDRFPSYAGQLKDAGFSLVKKGNEKVFTQAGKHARETLLEGIGPDGEDVLVLLTEVNTEYSVIITLGIAKPGDEKSISDFRELAATLTIRE